VRCSVFGKERVASNEAETNKAEDVRIATPTRRSASDS